MKKSSSCFLHWIPVICFLFLYNNLHAQEKLIAREYDQYLLTHVLTPAGPIPTAIDPNGIYPYPSYVETSHRPVLVNYHFIELENNLLKVVICPDLGGKIISLKLQRNQKEVLYVPSVIKYTRILPRFYFVAGGIEVSFPVSHSPVQNEKLKFRIDRYADRIYVTCGEKELRFGMQWSVEYSLGKGDAFVTERMVYTNPGKKEYPWMSWSNAAVAAFPNTEFYFPKGRVLSHASKIDTIDWVANGPRTQNDIKEMTGYFWKTKDVNAFGVFNPATGTGLFHVADEKIAGGVKLWSYGTGEDSTWSTLSTEKNQQYLEIQGGPLGDQSIKAILAPREKKWHTEYWIPSDHPLDLYALQVPGSHLRSVNEIPLFGWARKKEVDPWISLVNAAQNKSKLSVPPALNENCWPPSGMENLDAAFLYAQHHSTGQNKELWNFYYGSWLAGCDRTDKAIEVLQENHSGPAEILLARLYRAKGKTAEAVKAIESVQEPWLFLHPQVVVERDKILRSAGLQTLEQRGKWLSAVDALQDEWIIERKIQWLIDKEEFVKAKELLLSAKFQKVHQTYTRSGLWKQICEKLNLPFLPIPQSLGEDRLANFGAYREYE